MKRGFNLTEDEKNQLRTNLTNLKTLISNLKPNDNNEQTYSSTENKSTL